MLLMTQPLAAAIPQLGSLMWSCFIAIMGGMLLIAAVDVPFQLYQHNKKLMMTKEEVRQEAKETEGNPGSARAYPQDAARDGAAPHDVGDSDCRRGGDQPDTLLRGLALYRRPACAHRWWWPRVRS